MWRLVENEDWERCEIVATFRGERELTFRCPRCERKIAVIVLLPFQWRYRTCPGCRSLWALEPVLDMRRSDQLEPGARYRLAIGSHRTERMLRATPMDRLIDAALDIAEAEPLVPQ